jgi:hypothetical protein
VIANTGLGTLPRWSVNRPDRLLLLLSRQRTRGSKSSIERVASAESRVDKNSETASGAHVFLEALRAYLATACHESASAVKFSGEFPVGSCAYVGDVTPYRR